MNPHLTSLDGLRGLAVLFVLFSHLSNEGLNLHPDLDFSGSGKYGVFLFFVLSAFLLSNQFFSRPPHQLCEPQIWVGYALRRVLRIFPLYVPVLVGTAMSNHFFHADFCWENLVSHLLLQEGKGIFWTIPVEFKYYLLLPIPVCFLMSRHLHERICLGTVFVFMVIAAANWQWPGESLSEMNGTDLGPHLVIFMLGTLIAWTHARQSWKISRTRWRWAFEILAGVTFLGILITVPHWWNVLTGNEIDPSHFHQCHFFYGLMWSVFILAHLNGVGFFRWMFSLKPFRIIGTISFSIYLSHLPVILLVKKYAPIPDIAKIALILTTTVFISLMSYALIEQPFIRMGQKQSQRDG